MASLARKILSDDGRPAIERAAIPRSPCASVPGDDPAAAGLLIGLESVGRGALVLDDDLNLVGLNGRADALLEHLVVLRDGRIHGRTPLLRQKIDRVIHQALVGGSDAVTALVALGAPAVVFRAIPLAPGALRFRRARVLLVVAQTGLELLPAAGLVRAAFGLTATEAEVALALAGGASAGTIARDRSVSRETVRSHLKTIYAKTGTKRQASLVASILQLRDVAPVG